MGVPRCSILLLAPFNGICLAQMSLVEPLLPEYVVQDRYFIRLRSNCTWHDHRNSVNMAQFNIPKSADFQRLDLFNAYVATFNSSELLQVMSDTPCVQNVYKDQRLHDVREVLSWGPPGESPQDNRVAEPEAPTHPARRMQWKEESQLVASWALKMITINKKEPIARPPHKYSPFRKYDYPSVKDAGMGVSIAYFGSVGLGINPNKKRFPIWRAREFDIARIRNCFGTSNGNAARGRGAASLVVGNNYGVAQNARICSFETESVSELLTGLHMSLMSHPAFTRSRNVRHYPWTHSPWTGNILILNLAPWEPMLIYEIERAIKKLDDYGIFVVVAAGDRNQQVGKRAAYSRMITSRSNLIRKHSSTHQNRVEASALDILDYPCKLARVVCVGAVNRNYKRAKSSNFGRAVNLWAPGEDILMLGSGKWIAGRQTGNGTDLASPLVAGIAAIIYSYERRSQLERSKIDTFTLRSFLNANSKQSYIQGLDQGSRNLLANTGVTSTTDPRRPYSGLSLYAELEGETDQDVDTRDSPNDSADEQFQLSYKCFSPESQHRITWEQAEKLYLRLRWERGHSNNHDEADAVRGETTPIPCIDHQACVFLSYTGDGSVRIQDSSLLADSALKILTKCIDEDESGVRTTGGFFQISHLDELGKRQTLELSMRNDPKYVRDAYYRMARYLSIPREMLDVEAAIGNRGYESD